MRHVLYTHIPVVNALDTYFEEFRGTLAGVTRPSGRQGASSEVLTATIDQRARYCTVLTFPLKLH